MFLLACLGSTAGMMAFTLQQTICISTCPPDYPYFPQVKVGTASLAWSFYIGWVGSGKYRIYLKNAISLLQKFIAF